MNNKGAPGLWNSSDILSWWFLKKKKKSCWKQSGFIKKEKVGNTFSPSCVGFVCVVCHLLSFVISPWYCSQMLLGRAPTSRMDQERENTFWHSWILQSSCSHYFHVTWLFDLSRLLTLFFILFCFLLFAF